MLESYGFVVRTVVFYEWQVSLIALSSLAPTYPSLKDARALAANKLYAGQGPSRAMPCPSEHSLCWGSMQHGFKIDVYMRWHASWVQTDVCMRAACSMDSESRRGQWIQRLLCALQALENMQQRQDYMARLLASAYHKL